MQNKITVSRSDFELQEMPDACPDASYLEQDGWEDRRKEYEGGNFYFIGIRASVEIQIPSKQGGYWTTQRITSPGLWGIESDSGRAYFAEVFAEESALLVEMLEALNIETTN
jgi:hypothetical protein